MKEKSVGRFRMKEGYIEPPVFIAPILDPFVPGQEERVDFAFTRLQRQWWLHVYTNGHGEPQCAFPMYDEERGFYRCSVTGEKNLEIHHVTPTGWIAVQKPWADPNAIDIQESHVGVALCTYHHDRVIHPDIGEAFDVYRHYNNSFKDAIANHNELAREGIIFWDNSFDALLVEIAAEAIADYRRRYPDDSYPNDSSWGKKPHVKKPRWMDESYEP